MKVFAIDSIHSETQKKCCFLVAAPEVEKATWVILEVFGPDIAFIPEVVREVCNAPNESARLVGFFGPEEINPLN